MTAPTYDCIVWHPGRMGGQATIGESRLTASTLAGMVWIGDSVGGVAAAYDVPVYAVELSCWWLALHHPHPPAWARRAARTWHKWAIAWGYSAWHRSPNDNYPHPGPPPARKD